MAPTGLPEALLTRFRTLSLERIGRVESFWQALIQGVEDADTAQQLLQDLHSLKGEARIVEFLDVHLLCQKLEDLIAAAARLDYKVPEDFDLVVTMAVQFIGVLLKKKGGAMGGLDLEGFVRQIDEVLQLAESAPASPLSPRPRRESGSIASAPDRVSEATQQRFAIAAAGLFVEHLAAADPARRRLRWLWELLRDEIRHLQSVDLASLLDRHIAAAEKLAAELDKEIAVELDVAGLRARPNLAEALDLAALHLIRNAIDHGVEPPDRRREAGKPAAATIRMRGRMRDEALELSIEDDGAGIDLEAVRARARERGLIGERQTCSDAELCELLFHPGFSTRDEVSEISGRGVGLDAVKAAITRLGGSVGVRSEPGRGTSMILTAPARRRSIRVYRFSGPANVPLAVPSGWAASVHHPAPAHAVDALSALVARSAAGPADRAIRFSWGFLEVVLRATSDPELTAGERVCATPEDHPVEVIAIDGVETLLLRPERLAGLAS